MSQFKISTQTREQSTEHTCGFDEAYTMFVRLTEGRDLQDYELESYDAELAFRYGARFLSTQTNDVMIIRLQRASGTDGE